MKEKRLSNYNDGIMKLYKKTSEKNVRSMDDLEYLSKLAFSFKSIRQEDIEFAEQNGAKLSLKVVTPDDGNHDVDRNAIIEGVVYGIIYIDIDREKRELYFYLKEVRKGVN